MDPDEIEKLVAQAEREFLSLVSKQLAGVRSQYLSGLDSATELVAARFSVSSIAKLWQARVPRLMENLRGIFRRSARTLSDGLNAPLPSGWAEEPLRQYERATEPLLMAVGDHMAEAATAALAEGLNNGEVVKQLKARLSALFGADGFELGPDRASLIGMTEATRAWNAAALAAAEAVTGPDRPLVKQWRTRGDARVRKDHADADGQVQLLSDPFTVGGFDMQFPGDPSAPADLVIRCRCIMLVEAAPNQGETVTASADDQFISKMPPQLKAYWLTGPGAAKIRWGTPGAFDRCVKNLRDDFPQDPEGLCANLYHDATGRWPGRQSASNDYSDSGMIALIPTAEDAARLALDGGEDEEQLHCTLVFLGDITEWSETETADLVERVGDSFAGLGPVQAKLFGVNQWNPTSDSPAWVWATGDQPESDGSCLPDMRAMADVAVWDAGLQERIPEQHSPWVAHVTGAYADDQWPRDLMVERCGPVTFDRVRVAIGGMHYDIPLTGPEEEPMEEDHPEDMPVMEPYGGHGYSVAAWSTPDPIALAFENQETGDGRIFAPDALYWEGGPWPLQYADEMLEGHMGAQLAGAITNMYRDGGRIAGEGILYTDRAAGWDVHCLLSQGAPVGVSVDLDDVTMEFVSMTDQGQEDVALAASLSRAQVLRLPDGGWMVEAETAEEWTASGTAMAGASTRVKFFTEDSGTLPTGSVLTAFGADLTAAAGDPDGGGTVLGKESSGDVLVRITRARVRGATVVTIPAYATATIALEAPGQSPVQVELNASTGDTQWEVIQAVRSSLTPMTAAEVAQALRLPVQTVRDHLSRATEKGHLVRIARGLYVGPLHQDAATAHSLSAAVSGSTDLPVAGKEVEWEGDAATGRVFEWADGDAEKIGQGYLWRDPDKDGSEKSAWKLGFADVIDGTLTIVPRGVFAAAAALQGARGGVDIPAEDVDGVKTRVEALYARMRDVLGDDTIQAPWLAEENAAAELEASAWTAMQDLPAMPAAWFKEPTAEELPPGSGGVHYADGRVYGWVAQAGEPHAGFAQKVTIDSLGSIDTTHFLRQRFTLDDGSTVKAGAFTMNAGHHRDGAECETASCQFDDTRTVAGVVTVGMSKGGMWFSGAAAPWLSEWDRVVFQACQPSYHLKKNNRGGWQLRAVLSVPVPGHSSPLLASAVAERASMALAASAAMAQPEPEEAAVPDVSAEANLFTGSVAEEINYARLAEEIVAATARAAEREAEEARELSALQAEAAAMAKLEEITASGEDAIEGEEG